MMSDRQPRYQRVPKTILPLILLALAPAALATSWSSPPAFINQASITQHYYDGINDDLASAGLGSEGLQAPAPTPADPLNPTTAELRRLAIYNNYRALVDFSSSGGFGRLYGPNINADGKPGQGLISGYEFLAFTGKQNVGLLVQVPDSFNPDEPCIVTAPSSGSRGIYGAIGTAGDWGLKNGCAVAYTDAGKGTGAHNLQNNTVIRIDGTVVDADVAGNDSLFSAPLTNAQRLHFNEQTPHRFAFKHAHSQKNPERDWGRYVLRSIRFAFYVLNTKYNNDNPSNARITPNNTIVIASSVSNGGGASVQAAEQDYRGLIDGVAVSEPNVNPRFNPNFSIVQGDSKPLFKHSRSLYDYTTLINVYQSCANLAAENLTAALNFAPSSDACASLHDKGMLHTTSVAEQANEAQQIINDYGILPEQNNVQPSHWFINVPQGIAVTYANAYGRFSVARHLCGYSFGAVNGENTPAPLTDTSAAILFATANGIPPTAGIQLINNNSPLGAQENRVSVSPSTGRADQNLDGALCLRGLATGFSIHSGNRWDKKHFRDYIRVKFGIRQVRVKGNLHSKPTIFVTGRSDAILAPNHTSRAYFGLNQWVEGKRSNMRYYEVTNAQHLDVLNSVAGFSDKFIPLHHYFLQSLDLMYAHLKHATALPESQVIHTRPRGINGDGTVPDLDEATHLPRIAPTPPTRDKILFSQQQVRIPD